MGVSFYLRQRKWLLIPHGLRRMDMWDEVAGSNKYEDAHEKGDEIDQDDDGDVQFHGNSADIIGTGVEFDDSRELLKEDQSDTDHVSNQHTFSDDENSEP